VLSDVSSLPSGNLGKKGRFELNNNMATMLAAADSTAVVLTH